MAHIFISYSHKDIDYVEKLEKKLVSEGFDVWVDHRIDYGSRWTREIEKAIDTCGAYVVIMSKNSAESQWVERERIHAEKRRKPFFPLLLDGEGWFSLGNIQFLDVRGSKLPPKDYYEDIARFVERKADAAAVGVGLEEAAPARKNRVPWVGAALGLGLLVLIGFALKGILSGADTELGGTPMYATPIDQDSLSNPVEPIREPEETSLVPPKDAQLGDTWMRPTDGMMMSYVPAGEFEMGSEDGDEDEKPVHTVYLDAFWIDQTEVTNTMYAACVATGRCWSLDDTNYLDDPAYSEHPVVFVSRSHARLYCEAVGGRLPTEAEWEKAARGTDGRTYPWGEGIACSNANSIDCVGVTTAVGTYDSGISPYGLYDMAGNVWEWTEDAYDPDYYPSSPLANPLATEGQYGAVVVRGGAWNSSGSDLRTTNRQQTGAGGKQSDYGFRCVRSVVD